VLLLKPMAIKSDLEGIHNVKIIETESTSVQIQNMILLTFVVAGWQYLV
jgi:hypothetical protein